MRRGREVIAGSGPFAADKYRVPIRKAPLSSASLESCRSGSARFNFAKAGSLCLTILEGINKLRECEVVRCKQRKSIFLGRARRFAACNTANTRSAEET
jgi:hypothetical protein